MFYFFIFHLIGKRFPNQKFRHYLMVILRSAFIAWSYFHYFSHLIKNDIVDQILSKNFIGLVFGAAGFSNKGKKIKLYEK